MPMWLIRAMTMKKKHKFSAYYENDLFVGILYTIENDDMLFVFYIAVNDIIQSKGYGSKLLQMLIEKYKNKPIALFVETLDPSADNYNQRVKRFAFYEKNGFFNTGVKAGFKNSPFIDILATDKDFSLELCKKMVKFTPLKIFTETKK